MLITIRRRTYSVDSSLAENAGLSGEGAEGSLEIPIEDELDRYVGSFRHSSDRVRHLLVSSLVGSVISFAAFWNGLNNSWSEYRIEAARTAVASEIWRDPEQRLADCYDKSPAAVGFTESCELIKRKIATYIYGRRHGEASLRALLAELEKNRVERILMIDVPFVGIHFDINDLGAFSAIGLSLIAFALFFSMIRQQENLVFCLWKVNRLCDLEKRPDDRSSVANFFYHELAMAQVFTRPPTLSRWRPSRGAKWFVRCVFLFPLAVQTAISVHDIQTRILFDTLRAGLQVGCSIALLMFSLLTIVYSRAGDMRWRETFRRINPERAERPQPSWWYWSRLPIWKPLVRKVR